MNVQVTERATMRPLLVAVAVDGIGSGLFVPFAVLYFLRTTAISAVTVGACLTAGGLLALTTPLVVGPLVDRFGPKTLVVAGNLLSAAAFAAYLVVGTPWQLVIAAFVAGAGQTTTWTALGALIGAVAAPDERTHCFALQGAARNAGYGLGGITGALFATSGNAPAYLMLAAINAVSFVAAAWIIGTWRVPVRAPAVDGPAPAATRYAHVLRDKRWLVINGTNMLLVICMNVLADLLTLYLTKALRQPAWLGGAMFTLNTVLVLATQTTVSKRGTRFPKPRVIQVAAAAWVVSFLCLWLLNAAPAWLVVPGAVVAVCALTLAEMLYAPTINALAIDTAPTDAPGRYLAIHQLSWGVGGAIAPGLLVWLLSEGSQFPWPVLIAICAIAALWIGALNNPRIFEASVALSDCQGQDRIGHDGYGIHDRVTTVRSLSRRLSHRPVRRLPAAAGFR